MSVDLGTRLGSLEITALLGKGGMGEVYRARDTKLKRDVAIKILPDEFSSNRDRLTRFQREAEVLASLKHPNIAAIYDLATQDQSQFIVLELVEGERWRIASPAALFILKKCWTSRSRSQKRLRQLTKRESFTET